MPLRPPLPEHEAPAPPIQPYVYDPANLGKTKRGPPYKISNQSIANMQAKPTAVSPYLMHAEKLAVHFRKGNQNLPLNLFWYSMALAAGSEDQRQHIKGKRYTTSNDLYRLLQKKPKGKAEMMGAFRRMTEQTYKWMHPGCWELENEDDTGLMDFVAPALYHLDYVLIEAYTKGFGEVPKGRPPDSGEAPSWVAKFDAYGLKDYYIDFHKNFAIVMGDTVPERTWKMAVGWGGESYAVGMLSQAVQKGGPFLAAVEHLGDDPAGRNAAFGILCRAATILSKTKACKGVAYWPRFALETVNYGMQRNRDGSHHFTDFAQLWRYGEDHMPVNVKRKKTDTFRFLEGSPRRFQNVLGHLAKFATYATALGHGSGDYRGITDPEVRRTWGTGVARKLIFLVEELGLLNEGRTFQRDPFFMLALNERSNRLEVAFDVKEFTRRYGKLHEIAAQVPLEGVLEFSGTIDWAFKTQAMALFGTFASWAGQLNKVPARSMTSAEYWAAEAGALQGQVANFEDRDSQMEQPPPLPVLPANAELSGHKRPRAEPVPEADVLEVDISNDPTPPEKRVKIEPSDVPPANVHADQPMTHVAAPSNDNTAVPGMPAGGAGRDGAAEEKTANSGTMQGTEELLDLRQDTPADAPIVGPTVVATSGQGKHPRDIESHLVGEKRPGKKPRPGDVAPMSVVRAEMPVIANHPQGAMGGNAQWDVARMVERIVAEEGYQLAGDVQSEIARMMAGIAQTQQWKQQFRQLAKPRVTGEWEEASGLFFFSDTTAGNTFGHVKAVNKTGPPNKIMVTIVGGQHDGTTRTVSRFDGVYRPSGPFPILRLTSTAGPQGRLPRLDAIRLRNQRAALTMNDVRNMVINEINMRGGGVAVDGWYKEGIPKFARQLAARFKQINWARPLSSIWNDYGFQEYFGNVFQRTGLRPREDVVRKVRQTWMAIHRGSADVKYAPNPTWAGRAKDETVPLPSEVLGGPEPTGPDPVTSGPAFQPLVPEQAKQEVRITDQPRGEAPESVSEIAQGLDSTSVAVIITVAIVALLLVYEL